jgi:NitT/TauT family transport system substrate-binding protein
MSGPARKWLALSILILMLGSGGTGPLLAAGDPMHLAESEHPAVPWTSPARYVDSAARALALADVPQVAYAGIYLALARGYFQQEGLDIRLEPFTTGEQTVPAVATGQVDVAPGAISAALFNALARGIDLKIVAGQSIAVPGYYNAGLMVRKELWDAGRVREYADLRGLRVAIPSWSSVQGPVWARLLAGGGLTEGDVQVVPLTPPDMPTALSNGGLDVGMMNEPFATRAIQLGVGVRWLSHGDIYPGQQITTLIYSPAFAERQP